MQISALMDNTNDPNIPGSAAPPVPGATPTPPPPPTPSWPSEPVNPVQQPDPTAQMPSPYPSTPAPSWPPAAPVQADPLAQTSPWSPPQPIPTSQLDNPWGVPTQVPPIDTTPPVVAPAQAPSQPSWMSASAPTEQPPTPTQTESAPTDLSQLIAGSSTAGAEPNTQTPATPETLVVSQSNSEAPEVPTLTTEGRRGIPKWLIGTGIGLLLVVSGASAYFILGIGQGPKTTTSVPAVTKQTTVKPPAPIPIQVPQATPPPASGSASFGQIGGNTQTATRAGDLMKKVSPTPSP